MARADLAAELDRRAAEYRYLAGVTRALDSDLVRARALELGGGLGAVLVRARDLDHDLSLNLILILARDLACAVDGDPDIDRALHLAHALAHRLAGCASALRFDYQQQVSLPVVDDRVERWVLSWLSALLPSSEQASFVAEHRGNLGDCQRWWERVDHLVGLGLGMPRLAVMMRRPGRRWPA